MSLFLYPSPNVHREASGFGFQDLLTYLLTHSLNHSMQQSPSWEANRFSASQEIPRILCNSKVHYRIYKCPPPVLILSQLKLKSYRFISVTVSKQPVKNALITSEIILSRDFNSKFSQLQFGAEFLQRCSKYCSYSFCLRISVLLIWKSGLNRFWFKGHNFTWYIQIFGPRIPTRYLYIFI